MLVTKNAYSTKANILSYLKIASFLSLKVSRLQANDFGYIGIVTSLDLKSVSS